MPKIVVASMVFLVAFLMPLDATTTGGVLGATPACAMQIADDPDEGGCGIAEACFECAAALGRCLTLPGPGCAAAAYWCRVCASKPIECDHVP